jgi:hypothetical protein
VWPLEEIISGDIAFAIAALYCELGVQRQHYWRQVGRRVGVRYVAPNRATVPHSDMTNASGGFDEHRQALRYSGILLDSYRARQGAYC